MSENPGQGGHALSRPRTAGWCQSRTYRGCSLGRSRATMRGEQAAHGENTEESMLFMVIERFKDNDMLPIYKRVRDSGRMLPDALKYVDSWVEPNFARCFQLMECDDLRLFQEWVLMWRGSGATLEIVPVVTKAVPARFDSTGFPKG